MSATDNEKLFNVIDEVTEQLFEAEMDAALEAHYDAMLEADKSESDWEEQVEFGVFDTEFGDVFPDQRFQTEVQAAAFLNGFVSIEKLFIARISNGYTITF